MTDLNLTSFYINGKWCDATSREKVSVINPANEQAIGSIPLGNTTDVDQAVSAARGAFASFSQTSVEYRAELLTRIGDLIEERSVELADAITREMGCARTFAHQRQLPAGLAHIRCAAEALKAYVFLSSKDSTAIQREAIGVCALITPWNWPLYQITAKVGPALAAGCTMILKPSEFSPYSAKLFADILHDAGVPAGVFNMIFGKGEIVGEALSSHPDIDLISITGSTRAGAAVARAAATTVKRVTQELGGKSPNVLLEDADFEKAVPAGLLAGFRNVGQSCSAPTRMLVPRNRLKEVEQLALQTVEKLKVGDPSNPQTDLGPVANKNQFENVQRYIEIGISEGAELLTGGPGRPDNVGKGFYIRPTVFSNVRNTMTIAQEEIFGPVLCIIPYDTEEEAVEIANDTIYGLGAQVQSSSLERARSVARRIRAGQVHINYPQWDGMAPFGGYKQSGNGREYGIFGLEEYLETKAILGYGSSDEAKTHQPDGNSI